jgi:putative inorganic carbon (HCO3(-)) transporter
VIGLPLPRFGLRMSATNVGIALGLCLACIIITYWQYPPASIGLLIVGAVLAYFRLEIALALLPLSFPYYDQMLPLNTSGFPAFPIAEMGLLICLGVAVLRHALRPDERRQTRAWLGRLWQQARPFAIPALLFLIGASLALLVSPDQTDSVFAYRREIIEPLVYFLLVLRYLRTPTDLARAIGALILGALVASLVSINQGFLQATSLADLLNATKLRIGGPTPGPNNFAFLLDRTIPIVLALTFVGALRHPADGPAFSRPAWREPLRWVCLALLVPLVWALYWTDSRGAELAVAVAAFFFLVLEIRSRAAVLAMSSVGLLGVVVFWQNIMGLVNEPGHGPAGQRLDIWKAALLMIRDHVVLGIGPDSFNSLYSPTAPASYLLQVIGGQPFSPHMAELRHPHNFILDFWISTGLLGLIAIFWLLGAFAVVVRRTYRRCAILPQGRLLQRLLLGLVGAMIASVVHGLVDNMYFLFDLAMIFWLFMGVVLVLRTIVQQEQMALHDKAEERDREVREPVKTYSRPSSQGLARSA